MFSRISGKTAAGNVGHVFLKGNLAIPLVPKALKNMHSKTHLFTFGNSFKGKNEQFIQNCSFRYRLQQQKVNHLNI